MVTFRGDSKLEVNSKTCDIEFQILDWFAYDEIDGEDIDESCFDENDSGEYTIRVFGIDKQGHSISLKINGFKPYFFVKIPDNWNSIGIRSWNRRAKKWSKNEYDFCWSQGLETGLEFFLDALKNKMGNLGNSFYHELIKRHIFRGFTYCSKNRGPKLFKFIKLVFNNELSMNRARWILNKKLKLKNRYKRVIAETKFELYESNISPALRFIHNKNINPAGWINVKKYNIDLESPTRCQLDITADWNDVKPSDKTDIAPIIFASYDIESDSSHGDFPQAVKTYQKLAYDIIYKLYDIKRTFIKSMLADTDVEFKTIHDIDAYATTQKHFEELCKANLKIITEIMILHAFFNIEDELNLKYNLNIFLEDISKIYTKKNKKPRRKTISSIMTEVMYIVSYLNRKNNTKEVKAFRDAVKYLKCAYIEYDLKNLEEKVNSLAYCKDGKNNTKKIPFYYRDLLTKLANRSYLVNQLDTLLSDYLPDVEGDKVIQIGTTCQKYGESECFLKHIITLKSCDNWAKDDPNLIVESYETEKEVLLAWTRFINRLDPDIILGYNIFGFDFAYMYHRAEELGIEFEFSLMSRMKNMEAELINKQLASSALGDNNLYYMNMIGVVLVDLFKVIQKNYNLPSYKLNDVSKHFMGNKKDDVSPKQIFEYQKKDSYHRALIAKYCIQDCVLCNKLCVKLDVITNNIGMANVCSVPLSYIFLRGQGIKIFSLVAKECRMNNYLLPVLKRIESKEKKEKDKLRDKIPGLRRKKSKMTKKKEIDDENCSFEGAIVLKPQPGVYFDPIAVLDYSSLYPSSIISENLSHETYCIDEKWHGEEGAKKIKQLGFGFRDIKFNIYENIDPDNKSKGKRKVGDRTCRYIQYPLKENGEAPKGIIPNILRKLLQARKNTRAKIKTETDVFKKSVLDGLQLAYKITANSLYGQIGAKTSNIRLIDIAASTTAIGRELVMFAKEQVEKEIKGTEVIYGDTDSVFVKFPLDDENGKKLEGEAAVQHSIDIGLKFEKIVKNRLKPPHNLEYEKTFWPFVLLSKKRYVGNKYEFNTDKYKQTSMGIVLKRRDNAEIVKHIYGGVIDIIMNQKNIEAAKIFLKDTLLKIINGEFKLDMFIITKSLRANYKDPKSIAHKVLADRMGERDPGNKPQTNDRIPYAYINVPKTKKKILQGERIEHPEYIKENKLKLDYLFYITNQIMKPVSQVFSLIMENPESLFEDAIRIAKNRKNNTRPITHWFKRANT